MVGRARHHGRRVELHQIDGRPMTGSTPVRRARATAGARGRHAATVGAAVAALMVVGSAPAWAGHAWESQGEVRADVNWGGTRAEPTNLTVAIRRGGATQSVPAPRLRGWGLPPRGATVVAVRDLDGDREPEVVLSLHTPSIQARHRSIIARWNAAGEEYRIITQDWGAGGYRWLDLNRDGGIEWLSTDHRLGTFGAPRAVQRQPLQIWELREGVMTDVTRSFPGRVRADMRSHRSAVALAIRGRHRPEPALAAYLATAELLGDAQGAWTWARSVHTGPTARAFFARLQAQLVRTGYRR